MSKSALIESSETAYLATYVWFCPACKTRNRSTRPGRDTFCRARCGSCHQAFYLVHPTTKRAEPCLR